MALLAVLDVDDLATEKIKRTKTALEDLVQTATRSATALARNTAAISQAGAGGGNLASTANNVGALMTSVGTAVERIQTAVKAIEQLEGAVGKMVAKFQTFKPAAEDSASGLDKLKAQALAVGAALTYLGANMKDTLEEAARLAARVEMLGVVTQITARNAGYTTAQLQAQTEGIKKLGITTQEATDAVLQFVRSNLSLADATKLARVAQNLAVVSGENSSQTFERLTRAIQMQETMLLRQVGIVTTNEQLWREYAQTIGKTVAQLSQADKQQAFVNKILNEGAKVAGAYEASMETAGKQLTSMARLTEELSLKIGQVLLPAFSAIVKAVFSVLEWLSKLNPFWITLGTSMATAVTVMALVTGGIVTMTVAIGSLILVLDALKISMGPVGWIALGLGVIAGALVAVTSSTKATTMQLAEQAAVVNENTKTIKGAVAEIDKLTASGVEMAKAGEKETEQQKALRTATDDLAKAVPSARDEIDKLTGSYVLNRNEIYRVLAANEELRKTLAKGAELQIAGMELEKRAAEQREKTTLAEGSAARKRLEEMKAQIDKLEERAKKHGRDPELEYLKGAYDTLAIKVQNYGAANLEAAKEVAVLTVKIKNAKELVDEMNMTLPDRQKKILEGVTHGWDEFEKRAKKVSVSLKAIANFKLDDTNEGKFRQMVGGLMADVEKAEQKAAAAKTKYTQAFDSALQSIRGDAIATKGQLDAVNKGLGEYAEGTDEYRERVIRASSAIQQFNKANAETKAELTNLAKAAEYLKGIELEKWVEGVNEQFGKMALAGAEAMNKVSQGLSGDINKMFLEQLDKEFELRQASAEKIYDLDKEVADKRAEATLDGVDLAIYQENLRVEGIERALEREIAARERVQAKAEALFEDRVRQAQAEVRDLERNIKLQMDMREELAAQEIKYLYLTMKLTEEEANQKLELLFKERDAAVARNHETAQMRLEEIKEEADVGRRRLQQSRDLNAQIAKDQRSALNRQKVASAEYVQQLKRDNSVVFQLMRDLSTNLATSISKGFIDILTQARSTKDAFIGIVKSMADTVLNIIQDMIARWIKKAALLATTDGGFNVGTFFRAFMGGGAGGGTAMAGGAGGQASGGMGWINGIGTPVAGASWGAGAGAPNAMGGTGGAGAMFAGSMAAGTGGYMVGSLMASKFGRDSYFHSGGIGAASGAATGAAVGSVVPGIGTGVGAGIGAIAGAIGGWMQERKRRKEMAAERDQIVKDMGGLDEFKRKAEEAGVALDKFLDTKKSKVYAAELDKIQKAFLALDIKKFIEAQGGMDAIVEKAKKAGIELTDAFKNGTGEAAEMAKELDKVAKALALQEGKDGLAKTVTQMDDLRKRAVLVGYDLKKLYDTKTIEEFNNEQAKLNKLLEAQQLRLQGLNTMAAGVAAMTGGLMQKLDKAFTAAQKDKDFKGTLGEFVKLDPKLMADTQAEFTRLGNTIASTFQRVLKETGDVGQAYLAIAEPLAQLTQLQHDLGLEASKTFTYLSQLGTTVKDNADVVASLSGIVSVLKGASDAGGVTKQMLDDMGASAAAAWQTMMDRGVAADQALIVMQPTLQALWEAQKNFGLATDETTQKLIDMGVEHGLVGDQFQSVNQKMLDMLMLIAEALGATIPEAYRNQQAAAEAAAGATTETTQAQAEAAQDAAAQQEEAAKAADKLKENTGGVIDFTRVYQEHVDRWEWRKPYDTASGGIIDMGENLEDSKDIVRDFADYAVEQLERVERAASSISLGHSPGGLKEIRVKSRDAMESFYAMRRAAERDLGHVERSVNAVNDAYAGDVGRGPRDTSQRRREDDGEAGIKIEIKMPETKVEVSAVDADGFDRVWTEKMRPRLQADMDTNASQMASKIAAAVKRHR